MDQLIMPDMMATLPINWCWKQRTYSRSNTVDVTITKHNRKEGVSEYGITFRNRAVPIVESTDYMVVGVCGKRLYFRAADKSTGYKVTHKNDCANHYVKAHSDLIEEYTGDYELQFDNDRNLYYIERI